ncbi:MAG: histidinol-phosphate aminotransferase [Paraglaciecola sp.]|jgi:histidinol-phosphate aminotransferase
MSAYNYQASRRNFIQQFGAGALLLGGGVFSSAFAQVNSQLEFRLNAKPLWLHFNENSLGMSPLALQAAQLAAQEKGNRYPFATVKLLRETLAERHGVDPEQIILGNGSTEVIQAIVTVAAREKATVLEPSPTFGDVRSYSQAEGLEVIQVPVGKGFITDISALKKRAEGISGPLLINICNPNNPSASIVDNNALVEWINNAPAQHMFLLDEAYVDYALSNPAYSSVLPLIKMGRENLIITRTFSKIYGMAGMRIGYGIAAPATAKRVRPFAAGFNLSATGIAAAMASLSDQAFYKQSLASNQAAKLLLVNTLDELGLEHVPSNTNFVLHRIGSSLKDYTGRMADNGIYVGRRMTTEDNWNRISIGTPPEMQAFAKTLKAFRQKGWV